MATTHGMSKTKIYQAWNNMKNRCLNANHPQYKHYGGRGVKICDKWMTFEGFCGDMHDSYVNHLAIHGKRNTTLERKNVEEGYNPSNVIWATMSVQQSNKRPSHRSMSGVVGVTWDDTRNKWRVRHKPNGKERFIGYFDDLEEAKQALTNYNKKEGIY